MIELVILDIFFNLDDCKVLLHLPSQEFLFSPVTKHANQNKVSIKDFSSQQS